MVEIKSFHKNFQYIEINNQSACAKIALQGAHLFEYKEHTKKELFWLSSETKFEKNVAIRGGIPLCWPSFGTNNSNLPQHGFARTSLFNLKSYCEIDAHTTELIFTLSASLLTREIWDYNFELEVKFTISDTLSIELTTKNLDSKEFMLTQALHSYFQISDISQIRIKGLKGKPYFDALTNTKKTLQDNIKFTEEFDAVFFDTNKQILLQDQNKTLEITTEGSTSSVVWNPWIKKCSQMSAMTPQAYKKFVCIESANAYEDFKLLQVQDSHTLKATFKTL